MISDVTRFLEGAYSLLNQEFFEGDLPDVVITIQSSPKTYGHYTVVDVWQDAGTGYREINLSAEHLNRPITEIIATLMHEMTHFYCALNGIQDVSRGGSYHNKNFKVEAEKRGLYIEYSKKIGWSVTAPSPTLTAFVLAQGWSEVDLARQLPGGSSGGKGGSTGGTDGGSTKKTSTRKYCCPECGISVRATKTVNIGCLDCGAVMEDGIK